MKMVWCEAGAELDWWSDPEGQEGTRRSANTGHVWAAEIPCGKAGVVSGLRQTVGPSCDLSLESRRNPRSRKLSTMSAQLAQAVASAISGTHS